jgi:hypothetical protein
MSYVRRLVGLALVAGSLAVNVSQAGSPLDRLSLFKRLEADPNKTYPLEDSHGPWLILAATFSGEGAEKQANELVIELRREFKVPAYRHAMTWDLTGSVQGRGVDAYGRPKVMKHALDKQREEIAVLIGDFATLDDTLAQATLDKVRYMKPQCLDPEYITEQGRKNSRTFAGWRYALYNVYSKDAERKQRGPMAKAFLVTNPLIPQEYFRPKGIDPFVERLNAPLPNSLLNCPGRYTIKIATFTGTSVMLPKDIEKIERGEKSIGNRLEQAAMQAHKLAAGLREIKGWEAYEFHDESQSIVTVGSFDSLGVQRPDGTIEYHHDVLKIFQAFGPINLTINGVTKTQPNGLVDIPYDPDPEPIEVPRRSIAADYQRR